jgi:N-acetylglucosaminyldiphosphoundecaprenol N-acetyl-beta-D-mannosaminyltransferase
VRVAFLGAEVDLMTVAEVKAAVREVVARGGWIQHGLVNVAKIVNMRHDPSLRAAVNGCSLVNIDGVGVLWAMRAAGIKAPERVNGTDLFESLLAWAAESNVPVFLLGAKKDVLDELLGVLRDQHPCLDIAGHHHGYFWDDEERVVRMIRESGASLLFVAITSPRKETFINKWRSQLGVQFAMGVGGSFDVLAGRVPRAPVWMQKVGMEWFFRVLQEPGRMWRRYLVTNVIFGCLMLWEIPRRRWRRFRDEVSES